ncbi:MAG: hypothetical protein B7Y80_11650 [Hyphomicrobium sp. 32-62-53]|nr:MAG: hypothetical protein B7Z29_01265 [Hyphomicrobium sp. 12-62-95]OYX99166.1 MAG: hypothetical protein B7Y80_11650 [Hyphomicrobium sp. 32-62-53]
MLSRALREPLLHFLGLALAIFLLYGLVDRSAEPEAREIVVTSGKIEQLSGLFAKTWHRAPTAQELKGLIDEYVKEEIYYREGMVLGLDTDDTVIRRRLRQKMEFLADAAISDLTPKDSELDVYLKAHSDRFRIEPVMAFQQIYFNPAKRGDGLADDAQAVLAQLRADPETDLATLGDQTLLPVALPPTGLASIGQTFGAGFADELLKVPVKEWAGPVSSSFGEHLVRVSARTDARSPVLAEVREAVVRDWTTARRKAFEQERLDSLLKRYRVKIESAADVEPRS